MKNCIFCSLITKEIPVSPVLATDLFFVIKDRAPKAPVHLLIMPTFHADDLNDIRLTEAGFGDAFMKIVQELSTAYAPEKAFNLIANNGLAAGQSVFHQHWHFLAGKNVWDEGLFL